jgi:hypothetical protein
MYAIAQLGQGLVEQHTTQWSVATVNAELAQDSRTTPATGLVSGWSPTASPQASHTPAKRHSGAKHRATPPPSGNSGKTLTSPGGTAIASCNQGLAELLSASPYQGFREDSYVPGPTAEASVTFTSPSIGVVMTVTCTSLGVPVADVRQFPRTAWSPHPHKTDE